VPGHPLLEQAQATLCRLADAPPAAEIVGALSTDVDESWRKPLVVGIGGELPARTELINVVCQRNVLDPYARALGSAAVRVKRGATSGFRAQREDGSVEEQAEPPDRAGEIATARSRATVAHDELRERETALVRVEQKLPRRPPWWAIWLWIAYWIRTWRDRNWSAEHDLARRAVDEARGKLAAIEKDTAALEAHARLAHARYVDGLRALASSGSGVIEVEITLAASPLPEGVELVELSGASRAGAEVDAVVLVQGDRVFAPVRGGSPLAIGDHAATLAALPQLLADARALRLARRVQSKVAQAMRSLADAIERKEEAFRARIDRVYALRIDDEAALVEAQLAGVRAEISSSVNAVVEHASVHLGSELAQLQEDWIGAIANARDSKSLDAALAKIDAEWHARPRKIGDEMRVLVMGGLGGSARDLFPAIAAALVPRGLPAEHARPPRLAPELPPVTLLPSLAAEAPKLDKPGVLSGLFRSFETRRTELREKVHERVERMREVAEAELLDAEPRLHQTIRAALATLLQGAIAQQQAWLAQALETERAAIAADRETIAPLVHVHDAVRGDAARLAEMIAHVELHQPAVAVAAAAADTASLSR
jgi:hypothetical protein